MRNSKTRMPPEPRPAACTVGSGAAQNVMIEPEDLNPDLQVIDLAKGPDAHWRDILRENPNDPRFNPPGPRMENQAGGWNSGHDAVPQEKQEKQARPEIRVQTEEASVMDAVRPEYAVNAVGSTSEV